MHTSFEADKYCFEKLSIGEPVTLNDGPGAIAKGVRKCLDNVLSLHLP